MKKNKRGCMPSSNVFKSQLDRKVLYDEVDAATPLSAKWSKDEHWTSATANGVTIIEVALCESPEAALAHELLHARLKIRGYKQYLTCIDRCPKYGNLTGQLLRMLDNELQHARFFDEFISLGFRPDQMYADSDANWASDLRTRIERLSADTPIEAFLSVYITLIAPGGFGTVEERKALEDRIMQLCPLGFWKRLKAIRRAIADFRDAQSLDAKAPIQRILGELQGYEPVWIGHEQKFPDSGFFVGQPFSINE